MTRPDAPITALRADAYRVPTEGPEADGTLEWDATTMVTVHIEAGGATPAGGRGKPAEKIRAGAARRCFAAPGGRSRCPVRACAAVRAARLPRQHQAPAPPEDIAPTAERMAAATGAGRAAAHGRRSQASETDRRIGR